MRSLGWSCSKPGSCSAAAKRMQTRQRDWLSLGGVKGRTGSQGRCARIHQRCRRRTEQLSAERPDWISAAAPPEIEASQVADGPFSSAAWISDSISDFLSVRLLSSIFLVSNFIPGCRRRPRWCSSCRRPQNNLPPSLLYSETVEGRCGCRKEET